MKEIKRNSRLIRELASKNIKLNASAIVDKTGYRKGYTTICLIDIIFTYKNEDYLIDHCWLQQRDYQYVINKDYFEIGKEYSIDFTFYEYRDKVTTGQCGMKVKRVYQINR